MIIYLQNNKPLLPSEAAIRIANDELVSMRVIKTPVTASDSLSDDELIITRLYHRLCEECNEATPFLEIVRGEK